MILIENFLHEYWGFAAKSSIAELGNAETSHYKYCLENNKTEEVQIAAKNNQSQTHQYVALCTHCRQPTSSALPCVYNLVHVQCPVLVRMVSRHKRVTYGHKPLMSLHQA